MHRVLALFFALFTLGSTISTAAPATDHPRLWIKSSDLPRLRAWAADSNPMYAKGLAPAASEALNRANEHWNWRTGTPDAGWSDTGSSNWEGDATEAYALMFAFMSLVDPDVDARPQWALRARALLMYAINEAAKGAAPNHPFRDPSFSVYNRSRWWGEAWGLTVDWIYPSLTATDKARIRKVFLRWGGEILNAATAGNEHPQPVGLTNDPILLGSGPKQTAQEKQRAQLQLRWAANNYYLGHMRNLGLMSLAFDRADDPPGDGSVGSDLRSLADNSIGAWLYQVYALFETAPEVRAKLKLQGSNHSLGLAAGGLPVEGAMYGDSVSYLFQFLYALHTAGYTDTATYGPQVALLQSDYWNQAVDGFLHSLTPRPITPTDPDYHYLGPIYRTSSYGDVLRSWVTDTPVELYGLIAAYDRETGNTARRNKSLWILRSAAEGGSARLYDRAARVWGNSYVSHAILHFMAFPPGLAAPGDPRPTLKTAFVAPPLGRIIARSEWGGEGSWFSFRCVWQTINHQNGDCGGFEFGRKNQWLTKEWSGYAIDNLQNTPLYHNILSIQNDTPKNIPPLYGPTLTHGGQFNNEGAAGDASFTWSVNDHRAVASVNGTVLYNHPAYWHPEDDATDVTTASRTIVWLNPDDVVIYDRATTKTANRFKYLNLVLMAKPSIQGKAAITERGGQRLTIQSLLPADSTLTEAHFWTHKPSEEFNQVAELEPAQYRLRIAAPQYPRNARFLTVLHGSDGGVTAPAASLLTSVAQNMDGALVGNTAVLFSRSHQERQTAVNYQVPLKISRHLLTGLQPTTTYNVSLVQNGQIRKVTVSENALRADRPLRTYVTDANGVLDLGFPTPTNPPQVGSKAGWRYLQPM